MKWLKLSVLYSRGHCSGERKEKKGKGGKEKKREEASWLAQKVASPDKYLAQENLRRNPGALAVQTTSWFIITSYRPWLMHSNNQGASSELQCPGVLSATDFKHSQTKHTHTHIRATRRACRLNKCPQAHTQGRKGGRRHSHRGSECASAQTAAAGIWFY